MPTLPTLRKLCKLPTLRRAALSPGPEVLMQVALLVVLAVVVALVAVVLVRTFGFRPPVAPAQGAPDLDPGPVAPEAIERLGAAIRIPTISTLEYEATDFAPFEAFQGFLADRFPLFHERCELEVVNGHALIYRWPCAGGGAAAPSAAAPAPAGGPNAAPRPPAALLPVALMAHYDVVPVEEGTEQDWEQPPFSGALVDGVVWGRGTLDIKSQLMAHLEAAENLMRTDFVPKRDIYFCYGHDEEVGGEQGAELIVERLKERGVRFAGVLDEGGLVVTGALSGVGVPIGLIGVAEKGISNYQFRVRGTGGHSSMPPKSTSLGLAARLIALIERQPLPLRLTVPVEGMLRRLCGQMGFVTRMAVANLWLFRPLLLRILAGSPTTNAMVRTTSAVTMAAASDACNVLPQASSFNVNVRILPGETTQDVQRHFEGLIARAGLDATVGPLLAQDPSPVSPDDSAFYRSVERLASEFYPSALVVPYLVMGGTDSRQFCALSDDVLRFTPIHITEEDRQHIHGTNECLSVENYGRMIAFYERFLREE
ncbi:MAG: M20/M25/M40 family metallo-hydrolase [Coriobacteriales bacterium]|nr:M20/M25/M40 family metallo-hydrolase [Coriobacteriales bacterium]